MKNLNYKALALTTVLFAAPAFGQSSVPGSNVPSGTTPAPSGITETPTSPNTTTPGSVTTPSTGADTGMNQGTPRPGATNSMLNCKPDAQGRTDSRCVKNSMPGTGTQDQKTKNGTLRTPGNETDSTNSTTTMPIGR